MGEWVSDVSDVVVFLLSFFSCFLAVIATFAFPPQPCLPLVDSSSLQARLALPYCTTDRLSSYSTGTSGLPADGLLGL